MKLSGRPRNLIVHVEPALRRLQALLLRGKAAVVQPLSALPGRIGPPRHVAHDVAAFARLPGVRCEPREPALTVRHPVPPGADEVYAEYEIQSEVELEPTYVLTIPEGRVCGADAEVIGPDDTFFAGVANRFVTDRSGYPLLRRPRLPAVRRVPGRVAVIGTAYADYYYHWMTEVLPRFAVLGPALRDVDLVATPSTKSFQAESLDRLGIPQQKRLALDAGTHIQAAELVVPSLAGMMNHVRPASIDFVRDLFDVKPGRPADGRKLYVSREGEARRRVTNESEVIDLVRGFGFEVVHPGEMTVSAQADLFAQAEMVIGPHGGGLTNMIFSAPGTTILELISPVFQVLCYWTLASSAGLNYELHFGLGPKATKETQPRYSQWQDIEVDCGLLARRLHVP